jgi:hypothetical protein
MLQPKMVQVHPSTVSKHNVTGCTMHPHQCDMQRNDTKPDPSRQLTHQLRDIFRRPHSLRKCQQPIILDQLRAACSSIPTYLLTA